MPFDLYYTMVFTDQGMGNLVSITDRRSLKVKFTALIDFGSSHTSLTLDSVTFLSHYITANRIAGKPGPDLDLVVVSHQDSDHWNLFPKLITMRENLGTPLTIGKFYRGGPWATYGKGARFVVGLLKGLAAESPEIAETVGSHYAAVNPLDPLATITEDAENYIKFVPVIVNATAAGNPSPDIVRNTASMMVAVIVCEDGVDYPALLLPGDLTSPTIVALNEQGDTSEIADTIVLSLPHHGSHRTLADDCDAPPANRSFDLAKEFAELVTPRAVAASAGFATHCHPYQSVIDLFSKYVKTGVGGHSYIAFSLGENRYVPKDGQTEAVYTNYISIADRALKPGKVRKPYHLVGDKRRIMFKISLDEVIPTILDVGDPPSPGLAAR